MKICNMCDQPLPEASGNRKYCADCKAEALKQRQHEAHRREKIRNAFKASMRTNVRAGSLSGMTLNEIAAAARKHGMTYGQYVAAVEPKGE